MVIGGLASEPVPVLGEHDEDIAGSCQVSDSVHPWPREARPTLLGVRYFLQHLVPLAGRVLSQGFQLLDQGVAALGLLFSGDAGVEDGTLGIMPLLLDITYSSSFLTSSTGSTPKSPAILRMVRVRASE